MTSLGNSNRSDKDLAIDLIHASPASYKEIANDCFLSPVTVQKLAEEITKWPRFDTIERILKNFNVANTSEFVTIKSKYRNQPKG
jgi:hypothetical protein